MRRLPSARSSVDELQIWSKTLSDAEVIESMKGYKNIPEGLDGYFTFEETKTNADGEIYFPNTGKSSSVVEGAYMTIGKTENNVNTDHRQNQLTTALGVPMLTGSNAIKYESSRWLLDGAKIISSTDETATATYSGIPESKFSAKLTASNSWGSVSKTLTDYIVITSIDKVDDEAGYMIYPKPFEDKADILFAADGVYDVAVFAADGKQVASDVFEARAGELRTLSLQSLSEGVYVVTILSDGKALRSFKIVR